MKMQEIISIGIDPDIKGAIAFLKRPNVYYVERIPIKTKKNIDIKETYNLLNKGMISLRNKKRHRVIVGIEKQASRPGQSCVATHTAGENYGVIKAIVHLWMLKNKYNIKDIFIIPPITWKTIIGVSGDKTSNRNKAIELWGRDFEKKEISLSEAMLIALYTSLHFQYRKE